MSMITKLEENNSNQNNFKTKIKRSCNFLFMKITLSWNTHIVKMWNRSIIICSGANISILVSNKFSAILTLCYNGRHGILSTIHEFSLPPVHETSRVEQWPQPPKTATPSYHWAWAKRNDLICLALPVGMILVVKKDSNSKISYLRKWFHLICWWVFFSSFQCCWSNTDPYINVLRWYGHLSIIYIIVD